MIVNATLPLELSDLLLKEYIMSLSFFFMVLVIRS